MNEKPLIFLLLLVFLSILIFAFKQRQDFLREKKKVDAARAVRLARPVPWAIERSMRDFKSGVFDGEEVSPLSYIGYRVGITKGLPMPDRQIRLDYCFHMEMLSDLPEKYSRWGEPATFERYRRISAHLRMLADQRRPLHNYRHAVQHWDEDRNWFDLEFKEAADLYRRYGYAR
jgi:hypothetical protein